MKRRYLKQVHLLEEEDLAKRKLKVMLKTKFNIDLDEQQDLRSVLENWFNSSFNLRLVQGR